MNLMGNTWNINSISLTRITSKKPACITKAYSLGTDGELIKVPGGSMAEGTAERLTLDSAGDLPALIQSLKTSQALCYGVPPYPEAQILSKKILAGIKRNGGPPIIARNREHFSWPEGPGVMMLDYDPPDESMTISAFREILGMIAPEIELAPMVMVPSASGYIYHGKQCVKGPGGIRALVVVKNAGDIPRALSDLVKCLWVAGMGHIEASKSGALLKRSMLDSTVGQPERLDFLAGAACKPPLEQRRPNPMLFNADSEPLDTRAAIPPLTLQEQAEYKRMVKEAKEAFACGEDTWAD